ncbi:MAG: biopolymer transporter ExbD [Pseudomonadota bacterium]
MNFGVNQEEDETGIELTPLIDVVFLLLIFFMISTTFTKETTLKINLPEASGDQIAEQPSSVEVLVGAASEYAVMADNQGEARALINSNRETLLKALSEYSGNESLLLIIRADKKATHDAVIRVLDVAQELGMSNITFATKQAIN